MKTDVIKLRIDSGIKIELEKIATSEQRTLAGQIRLALQRGGGNPVNAQVPVSI